MHLCLTRSSSTCTAMPFNGFFDALRPACLSRRAKGLRGLFGAVAQDRVVPLFKAAVRRTRGGARLSVAYTHRIAIANSRLIAFNENGVIFRYKDYRADGRARCKTMTLATDEFIRRFLIHILPHGFRRIRHYGLFANGNRAANITRARDLLAVPSRPKQPEIPEATAEPDRPRMLSRPCPCCGGRMIIIEIFARGCQPKSRPTPAPLPIRIDTS